MHHLIWISRDNLQGIKAEEQLAAVGLADHAQGVLTVPTDGPDGSGTLYGWVPNRLHYNASEQEWFPAVPSGDMPGKRYWVGVWKDSPVKEQDLRRPYRYGGKNVTLRDESWLIPKPEELPHQARLMDDGSWRFVLQRQFHEYGLAADSWVSKAAGEDGAAVTFLDMLEFSLRAISLNYRLPPELASHLELFTQESVGRVFATALGLDLKES